LETAQQTLRDESRDFMRRFSSLEKKFQQAIREKEALQKQLDVSVFTSNDKFFLHG